MRILVSGLGGHMGAEVAKLCRAGCRGAELAAGVDAMNWQSITDVPCAPDFSGACTDVDCVVDFSHHACTKDLLDFGIRNRIPLVIATTGQTDEERAAIEDTAKQIPVFFAANFSLGIALLIELAKKAIARALQTVRPEAEIVCGRSGMAKRTKTEIGISAVRMGNIAGEHEVLIGTDNQTITLKHETHDRALFAEGALAAAAFLCGKPAGLYDMESLLAEA